MTLRDQVNQQMTAALKSQDRKRLEALRYLFSQLKNREIDVKHELTDEETIALLRSEAKRRRESVEAYQKGGRADLVEKEQYELSVIETYLPKQLSDEELAKIIEETRATNPGDDFGTLMKAAMGKVAGRADGKRVAAMIKTYSQSQSST